MRAIIGLGNPGTRYAHTRHNVGFMVVDEILQRLGQNQQGLQKTGPYRICETQWLDEPVLLVKPLTYVNRSGQAVRHLANHYDLAPEDLLVLLDDINLPFGRMRLRDQGSAGGHNGLRSIESHLEGREYPRLRLGVGAPLSSEDLAEYVLGEFNASEQQRLPEILNQATDVIAEIIRHGVAHSVPTANTWRLLWPEADESP